MSITEAIKTLSLVGGSESVGKAVGLGRDGHSGSLNHYIGTIIRDHGKLTHSQQVTSTITQKYHSKLSLEELHDRVRLYCEYGKEPLEGCLPSRQELQYRYSMVAIAMKRCYTISEEELADASLRNQLVLWMVKLHCRSKFKFYTLYQAVRLVDRYLSLRTPSAYLYYTLGATTLAMAVKLEYTMTSYTLLDWMLKLEPITLGAMREMYNEVLICLDFNVYVPNQFTFFELTVTYFNLTQRAYYLALYLLELTLLNAKYLRYGCNLLAVASVYLSLKLVDPGYWNYVLLVVIQVVIHAFSLKLPDVMECAKELLALLADNLMTSDCYTHRKFSKGRYCRIGRMKI